MERKLKKTIVLVGMMGSGKTFVGRKLAEHLSVDFLDTDQVIMEQESRSIINIFSDDGERVFREIESQTVNSLLKDKPCVVSLGGGAITTPSVLSNIKSNSISVWIKADIDVILSRLEEDQTRPLIQNDDKKEVVKSLLNEREFLYSQADIHVENNSVEISSVIENIVIELQKNNAV